MDEFIYAQPYSENITLHLNASFDATTTVSYSLIPKLSQQHIFMPAKHDSNPLTHHDVTTSMARLLKDETSTANETTKASTTTSTTTTTPALIFVYHQQSIITACLVLVSGLGIVLNMLLFLATMNSGLRKNATNIYLSHMAIANILLSCSVLVVMHNSLITWTPWTCALVASIDFLSVFLSVNLILLIALERYIAVRHPSSFKQFTRLRSVVKQLSVVWLVSLGETVYPVTQSKVISLGRNTNFCTTYNTYVLVFNLFSTVTLPVFIMVVLYSNILLALLKRRNSELSIARSSSSTGNGLRAWKPTIVVCVIFMSFLICYSPSFYQIVIIQNEAALTEAYTWIIMDISLIMLVFHTCLTAILQLFFNTNVRKGLFVCCQCKCLRDSSIEPSSSSGALALTRLSNRSRLTK